MDAKTELAKLSEYLASAQQDVRQAADKLHMAGIYLSNIRVLLNKPRDKTPRISKTEFVNVAGVTITTDARPSAGKDRQTRDLLRLCGGMGFNTARWLSNHEEVTAQLKLLDSGSPDCLVTVAKASGLTPVADTVELMIPRRTDAQRQAYFDGLKHLGFAALYVNDADRKDLAASLENTVKIIRQYSDLPLVASLTANANLNFYGGLFDHVEVQTFGTEAEFRSRYVGLPAILCIDGQRSASPAYLKSMLAVLLDADKEAFMVYTAFDSQTNWLNMPDTVALYREFLVQWWKRRGVA